MFFFPSKNIFLWKILVFPPLKTKDNQLKNLCNFPWQWMSAREKDKKITPVKSSMKIIAKLYAWKTNFWAARPSPPTFLKNTLEFHWIFCRRSPLGQIKIKINIEERSNFIGSTQNPYSKRNQKSQSKKLKGGSAVCTWSQKYFKVPFEDGGLSKMPNHKNPNLVSVSL